MPKEKGTQNSKVNNSEDFKRDIAGKTFYRDFHIDRACIDAEKRTVNMSFSSEAPVERFFMDGPGLEVLDHNPQSVRLDRLLRSAPLLVNHNPDDQVGVIENASIGSDRRGHAVVRFGRSARASEIFQDVVDGIRSNVSVGYQINDVVQDGERDGMKVYRVTDWDPLEVSMVPIPADASVGVGRSKTKEKKGERDMSDKVEVKVEPTPTPAPSIDVAAVRKEEREKETTRVKEILAIGERFKHAELARQFVENGKPVDEFRSAVLEKMGAKPIPIDPGVADIGMGDKEIRQYSLVRAIRQFANHEKFDGLEREVSDAVAKKCGRDAKGFYLPNDVMAAKRALNVSTATAGGYAVDTDVLGASMIELLRNKALVSQLGAKTLSGLTGNILIPKQTGGATAYWLSEQGAVTEQDQTFGQLGLTPHRLVGDTAYSKELLFQASIDVEAFLRDDLMKILAIAKDLAAINGSGNSGQPLGILNTTGVQTITFGGSASWSSAISFETKLAQANADLGDMAFLTTPGVRGKWKGVAKASNYPLYLWDAGANGSGMVNGYRAEATNQVPNDKVIFGNWNDLIIAEWAGLDVVVDPYSLKKQGLIEVTITLWCDLGVRHPVSFVVSTDSGAQ